MNDLHDHYRLLLGLGEAWQVASVDLQLEENRVEIALQHVGGKVACPECGVKTISVPWAGKRARITLMFEAFAIQVLRACGNVQRGAELLGLDWSFTMSGSRPRASWT